MSQVELLWAAVSLMLLGALVSMCMKCQQGSKQETKVLNSRMNQCGDQLKFEVPRSYSISRQEQLRLPHNTSKKSKSRKHHSISSHAGDCAQTRYQNVGKETQMDQEAAYVQPICADYYNCGPFIRPPSEDSLHYQNVAGPSNGSKCEIADVGIYENSAALMLFQAPPGSENSSDDEEADYVNAGPGLVPKSRAVVRITTQNT